MSQMIRALVTVALLAISAEAQAQQPARSLESVLVECGCLVPAMPESVLSTMVESDATFMNDDRGFVVAYWPAPHDREDAPWHVIAGNVKTGRWQEAQMPVENTTPGLMGGRFERIFRQRGVIIVEMRVAIDGRAQSILTPDLKRLAAVYATFLQVLPGGLVLYEHPQPHFRPTHFVTMALLDLASHNEVEVYPAKPYDRVRADEIGRLREFWKSPKGQQTCKDNGFAYGGYACDFPEDFDSELWSRTPAAVNETTHGIAFGILYAPLAAPDGAGFDVIVACEDVRTVDSIKCHETTLAAWQKIFPGATREQILRRAAANPRRVPWQ